jgi:hypothetical protein
MKSLLYIQLALTTVAASIGGLFFGFMAMISISGGGALMLLNLFALVFSWPRILAKKSIALATGVIVFKFAILGWIIYEVVGGEALHIGWFAVGMATVVPAVVGTAFIYNPDSDTLEKAEN